MVAAVTLALALLASCGGETDETAIEGPALTASCDIGELGLCFDCHLCPTDGVPELLVTHYVCIDCHYGDGGSVPPEVVGACGCDTVDCSTDPKTVPCATCHTPESPVYPSREYMNGLCTECHGG